jgi:hypothetical protein
MRYNGSVVYRQVDFLAFPGAIPNLGHPQNSLKSFGSRTSEKIASNPFVSSTSQTKDLKSFRIRTYEKTGEGVTAIA